MGGGAPHFEKGGGELSPIIFSEVKSIVSIEREECFSLHKIRGQS